MVLHSAAGLWYTSVAEATLKCPLGCGCIWLWWSEGALAFARQTSAAKPHILSYQELCRWPQLRRTSLDWMTHEVPVRFQVPSHFWQQ